MHKIWGYFPSFQPCWQPQPSWTATSCCDFCCSVPHTPGSTVGKNSAGAACWVSLPSKTSFGLSAVVG